MAWGNGNVLWQNLITLSHRIAMRKFNDSCLNFQSLYFEMKTIWSCKPSFSSHYCYSRKNMVNLSYSCIIEHIYSIWLKGFFALLRFQWKKFLLLNNKAYLAYLDTWKVSWNLFFFKFNYISTLMWHRRQQRFFAWLNFSQAPECSARFIYVFSSKKPLLAKKSTKSA